MEASHKMAQRHIQDIIGLPAGDRFSQDWAYELPEEYRTASWLEKYVAALSASSLGDEERRILMTLVLDVANDLYGDGLLVGSNWAKVAEELRRDPRLYTELVDYWCVDGELLKDCFALTSLVRQIRGK